MADGDGAVAAGGEDAQDLGDGCHGGGVGVVEQDGAFALGFGEAREVGVVQEWLPISGLLADGEEAGAGQKVARASTTWVSAV